MKARSRCEETSWSFCGRDRRTGSFRGVRFARLRHSRNGGHRDSAAGGLPALAAAFCVSFTPTLSLNEP